MRQGIRCQTGLDQSLAAGILVAFLELFEGIVAKARRMLKLLAQPSPVLGDRGQAAPRPPTRAETGT